MEIDTNKCVIDVIYALILQQMLLDCFTLRMPFNLCHTLEMGQVSGNTIEY